MARTNVGKPLFNGPGWPCALALVGGLISAGCDPTGLIVGAAATGGTVVAQERSVGNAIDDTAIEFAINRKLLTEDGGLFLDVAVDSVEGRVLLTGDVGKPDERIRAMALSWQVEGVLEVINEIQVTDRSGIADAARDAWISTQLRAEILFDKKVLSINYNIEIVNGVVYLIGIAQNQEELNRVIGHAREIPYVRQVVSHVRLKESPEVKE